MADIDNLKKINGAHGHLLGDYVVGEARYRAKRLGGNTVSE
jgi:GGDEF domain-containing protein